MIGGPEAGLTKLLTYCYQLRINKSFESELCIHCSFELICFELMRDVACSHIISNELK